MYTQTQQGHFGHLCDQRCWIFRLCLDWKLDLMPLQITKQLSSVFVLQLFLFTQSLVVRRVAFIGWGLVGKVTSSLLSVFIWRCWKWLLTKHTKKRDVIQEKWGGEGHFWWRQKILRTNGDKENGIQSTVSKMCSQSLLTKADTCLDYVFKLCLIVLQHFENPIQTYSVGSPLKCTGIGLHYN